MKRYSKQKQNLSLLARSCDSVTNLIRRQQFKRRLLFVSKQRILQNAVGEQVNFLSHQKLNTQGHFLDLIRSKLLRSLQIDRDFDNHNKMFVSGFVLKDSSGKKIDLPTGGEKNARVKIMYEESSSEYHFGL